MRLSGVISALALWSAAAPALAQDQQVGARTKAMGGSYTAFEDDPVSVWLNPAGIATQPDSGAIAYQTYTIYDIEVPIQTIEGGPAEYAWNDPAIVPSYLGAVFQLGDDGDQAVGFCFVTPFRMKMPWLIPDGGGTFTTAIEDQVFYRIRASYAKSFRFKPEGFLTHLSLGLGGDINVTNWTHTEIKPIPGAGDATLTISGTDMGFGGGAGLLVGLYDNTTNFKANLGVAYQSKSNYRFSIDFPVVPLFDWPNQYQAGLTLYLLEGLPVRVTFDAQLIDWSGAGRSSDVAGVDDFEDTVNLSAGAEVRVRVSEGLNLYPRLGIRRFDAPWEDADRLPAVGLAILDLDTRDDTFLIFTFGIGLGWSSESGKLRAFDLALDVGGDAPGFATGFTMEF